MIIRTEAEIQREIDSIVSELRTMRQKLNLIRDERSSEARELKRRITVANNMLTVFNWLRYEQCTNPHLDI